MIVMTRRMTFSAAHADNSVTVTSAANDKKVALEPQYALSGHNYVLDVSVRGDIDPKTGILVNIKEIDRIVRHRIVDALDNRFINREIARFQTRPVTLENLALFIAEAITPDLPPEVALSAIRLEAAPVGFVEWFPESNGPLRSMPKEHGAMLLTRVYEFAASHRLHSSHLSDEENRELFGKCNYEHGHGHNYEVEITIVGPVDARSGRVMAPESLDAIANREVIDRYDHRHFNHDIPEFAGLVPSAEEITRMIWRRLESHIPAPIRLYRVLVRETPRNIFEYFGEESQAGDK